MDLDLVLIHRKDGAVKLVESELTMDGLSVVPQPGVPPGQYMIVVTHIGLPLDNVYTQGLDIETAFSRVEQLLDYAKDLHVSFSTKLTGYALDFLRDILPVLD